MPKRDGTGPEGKGPGTGGKKGDCTPEEMKDSVNWKLFGKRRKGNGRGPKDGTGRRNRGK